MNDELEKNVMDLVKPVWSNTYWVRNALDQYDAIAKYATELNEVHGRFWGITQKFSIDAAVVGLCKVYDSTNKRYQKHTIYELNIFLKNSLSSDHARNIQFRVGIEELVALGIGNAEANKIVASFSDLENFESAKEDFFTFIENVIPKYQENDGSTLERLFKFRDKTLAHQEQLSDELKEQLASLPSLEDMHKLNEWADNFCKLFVHILSPSTSLINSCTSSYMATLNTVKKVLGKTFDDPNKSTTENWNDRNEFYKRSN